MYEEDDGEKRYKDASGNETAYATNGTVFRRSSNGIVTATYPDGHVVQRNANSDVLVTDAQGNTREGNSGDFEGWGYWATQGESLYEHKASVPTD
jgi:hypothetical protein